MKLQLACVRSAAAVLGAQIGGCCPARPSTCAPCPTLHVPINPTCRSDGLGSLMSRHAEKLAEMAVKEGKPAQQGGLAAGGGCCAVHGLHACTQTDTRSHVTATAAVQPLHWQHLLLACMPQRVTFSTPRPPALIVPLLL